MAESIIELKNLIRSEVKTRRARLDDATKAESAEGLTRQLKNLVVAREAKKISCYYPVRGEPNTLPFMEWALADGIEILLPSSREDGLLDWVAYNGADVEPGMFGIPEPSGDPLTPLAVNEVDLMLIPASAVDLEGTRLGWGRGFYDKSIASMNSRPPIFAIVYDSEVLESVPAEAHDAKIYGAVTPTRVLYF